MFRILASAIVSAVLLVSCGGEEEVQKDAGDIESDIADTMNEPKYQKEIQGKVSISCPDDTPDRVFDQGKAVQCTAEAGAGKSTDFKVEPAGGDSYGARPGEIAAGLSE